MNSNGAHVTLDALPDWLGALPQITGLHDFGGFQFEPGEALPAIHASLPMVRTLTSMLGISAMLNASTGGTIAVSCRAVPTRIDLALHLRPSPLFMLLYKSLIEAPEREHAVRVIETSPDAMITLLLARKHAVRAHARVWVQLDKDNRAGLHLYLPTMQPVRNEADRKPVVLIIEDTKMIGNLMELYLRQAGFQTMYAPDGLTGLRLAREHHPDMITLDVMMPEMDGWQVLLELKSNAETQSVPVVIVSVLRDRQIGFELGAADYLTKPIVREDLIACARRLTTQADAEAPELPGHPQRWILFSDDSSAASFSQSFPAAAMQVIAPEKQKFLEEILAGGDAPDLIVVDFRTHFQKAWMAVCRLRLHDPFDHVPVVAVCSPDQEPLLSHLTAGLVNRLIDASAFTPSTLANACAHAKAVLT